MSRCRRRRPPSAGARPPRRARSCARPSRRARAAAPDRHRHRELRGPRCRRRSPARPTPRTRVRRRGSPRGRSAAVPARAAEPTRAVAAAELFRDPLRAVGLERQPVGVMELLEAGLVGGPSRSRARARRSRSRSVSSSGRACSQRSAAPSTFEVLAQLCVVVKPAIVACARPFASRRSAERLEVDRASHHSSARRSGRRPRARDARVARPSRRRSSIEPLVVEAMAQVQSALGGDTTLPEAAPVELLTVLEMAVGEQHLVDVGQVVHQRRDRQLRRPAVWPRIAVALVRVQLVRLHVLFEQLGRRDGRRRRRTAPARPWRA